MTIEDHLHPIEQLGSGSVTVSRIPLRKSMMSIKNTNTSNLLLKHMQNKAIPNLSRPHNTIDQFDISLGKESKEKKIGQAALFGKQKANQRTSSI